MAMPGSVSAAAQNRPRRRRQQATRQNTSAASASPASTRYHELASTNKRFGPASSRLAGTIRHCASSAASITRCRQPAKRIMKRTAASATGGRRLVISSSVVSLPKGRSRSHSRALTSAQPVDNAAKYTKWLSRRCIQPSASSRPPSSSSVPLVTCGSATSSSSCWAWRSASSA